MPRRFTTPVQLPGDPTGALEAASKQYVDAADALAIPLTQKGANNGVAALTGSVLPRSYYQYANSTQDGSIVLTGDLGGTATSPTVPGLANKENTANKGANGGYCPLDSSGLVPIADLPIGAASTQVAAGNHVHNGDAVSGVRVARQTSDVSTATGSTTFVSSSLAFSVTAGGTYEISGLIIMIGNANNDYAFALSGISGVGVYTVTGAVISTTSTAGSFNQDGSTAIGGVAARGASGSNDFFPVVGYFIPSASGTLTFRFGQNTATTTTAAATLKTNSFLRCLRVA